MAKGFVKLRSEDRKNFIDLEARVEGPDKISVRTGIVDGKDEWLLGFTIIEIEALYHFSQLVKNNK